MRRLPNGTRFVRGTGYGAKTGKMKNYIPILCFCALFGCKETKTETKKITKVKSETHLPNWERVESKDGSKLVQRHEAAFVKVGQKFYLFGGRDIRPVSIYDHQANSWSTAAEPPIEMHHFQPVVFDEKIYVISALTGKWPGETPTEHVYIYDPANNTWSKGDEIPEGRRRGSTGNVLHEGKIYISCGIKDGHRGDHKKWLDRYDPKTGEWEILSDAPRPRDHFQAVLAEGKIYAAAGRNTGIDPDNGFAGTIGEVDVYDIATDSWETLANDIPTQRAGNAAIFFDGKIVVAGGESPTQEKAHAEVEALNIKTKEWRPLPFLLEGRHGTGLLEHEGNLYIASGCGNRGGNPELFTMEKFTKQ